MENDGQQWEITAWEIICTEPWQITVGGDGLLGCAVQSFSCIQCFTGTYCFHIQRLNEK